MIRAARARLHDIERTIAQLLAAARGRSLTDLAEDWAFGQACHFSLQTIGEAANHLPPELRDRYPEVPWRKIIALSHKVRHEYFRLDPDVIWGVITDHLPPLHVAVRRMVAEEEQRADAPAD